MHSSNHLVRNLMKAVSLRQGTAQGRRVRGPLTVGIWNGHEFVMKLSGFGPSTLLRVASRYGLSLVRLSATVKRVVTRWSHIYELQQNDNAFANPQQLFTALGLFDLLQEPSYEFLRRSGISQGVV